VTLIACVDVGSTFTKVGLVDTGSGELVATAAHPTTVDSDVLRGLDAAVASARDEAGGIDVAETLVCSSAGGGLRLAVVGYERLVTAEAGQKVALSAGGQVVHVAAGPLDATGMAQLKAARPDVVLLVGGTDGGDATVLGHNAARLATARVRIPVVLAGNADVRDVLTEALAARGVPVVATDNVLPRIGVLNPLPARAAIREVFLRHVIGGKHLSNGPRFASLVRAATPDAVLTAVEMLADHEEGDFAVVDVGGATTDVYTALGQAGDRTHRTEQTDDVAGTLWRGRSVEGDLGMRWSAPGVLAAARAERLIDSAEAERLEPAAYERARDPGLITAADDPVDTRLAALAATVAMRRHARAGGAVGQARDLSGVRILVGSGGVLRHGSPARAADVLGAVLGDVAGGWALPRAAVQTIDHRYVLACAGLLATNRPETALMLLRRHLVTGEEASNRHRRTFH
jgi:uncharacterized protein (TIGR01319 family)